MTTARTTPARPAFLRTRRAAITLLAGAGVALVPQPALADAGSVGATSVTLTAAPVAASSSAAQVAVDTALAQLGKPYVWAGAGPNVYDCSGLTQYAWAKAGVSLPHSSRMQSGMGAPVSRDALRPGDLVFFYSPVGHVGMYIGNGQMVHAPTAGDVVKVADVDAVWGYAGARRPG